MVSVNTYDRALLHKVYNSMRAIFLFIAVYGRWEKYVCCYALYWTLLDSSYSLILNQNSSHVHFYFQIRNEVHDQV